MATPRTPQKRGEPDVGESPPVASAKAAAIERGAGAYAVTSLKKVPPGDKLNRIRVSKDGAL